MSKPFNIHDWQAKQAKQRLTEISPTQPIADFMGKNIDKLDKLKTPEGGLETEISNYIGQTFATWMSPESRIGGEFIKNPPFAKEYAKPPYFDKLVRGIMDIVNSGGVNEHHGDEEFPKLSKKEEDYLDKLKSTDKAGYNAVEDYIKAMNEMSTTGEGASFNAGAGEGYMTPRAFKKKNK